MRAAIIGHIIVDAIILNNQPFKVVVFTEEPSGALAQRYESPNVTLRAGRYAYKIEMPGTIKGQILDVRIVGAACKMVLCRVLVWRKVMNAGSTPWDYLVLLDAAPENQPWIKESLGFAGPGPWGKESLGFAGPGPWQKEPFAVRPPGPPDWKPFATEGPL